jgi:hypothetical protein
VFQLLNDLAEFAQGILIFFRELEEDAGIGDSALELFLAQRNSLQAASFFQKLLGSFLVGPEVRRRGLGFNALELLALRGQIKETSLAARRACADPRMRFLNPE